MSESPSISAQLRDVFRTRMLDKKLLRAEITVDDFKENGITNSQLISQITMADSLKEAIIDAGFPEKYADFRITHRVYLNANGAGSVLATANPEIYEYIEGRKTAADLPTWGIVEDMSQYLSGAPQLGPHDDPEKTADKQIEFEYNKARYR